MFNWLFLDSNSWGVNGGKPSFLRAKLLGLSLINESISACLALRAGCSAWLAAVGRAGPSVVVVDPPPLTDTVLVVVYDVVFVDGCWAGFPEGA